MQIRITKSRAAMAALFVLAGVGLGSLLSPLVGSALATVGSTVNISDHSASAYFAKVDSSGQLKTSAVVSGKVAPALPPQPFNVLRGVSVGTSVYALGPTTATIAVTDLTLANYFGNEARELELYVDSAAAPNTNCASTHLRVVGFFDVPAAQTVEENFETPLVLKPLATGEAWCLRVILARPFGDTTNVTDSLILGGYVVAGTYTPTTAPEPAKLGRMMHRH
jgi:hypothetical protein